MDHRGRARTHARQRPLRRGLAHTRRHHRPPRLVRDDDRRRLSAAAGRRPRHRHRGGRVSASDLLLWTAAAILALATLTAAIGLIYLTVLVDRKSTRLNSSHVKSSY